MRIAQVAPYGIHPYSGGLAALVNLSAELARRGNAVEVWQLHEWPEDETHDLIKVLEAAGVERVAVPEAAGPWRLGKATERCLEIRTVDFAHLHSVFSPLNNMIARKLRVPYVISPHGGYADAVLKKNRLRKAVFQRLLELPMLQRAAVVFALTSLERAQVRQFGYRGLIEVLPNGLAGMPPDTGASMLRRELGIGDSVRLAVFVGRLDVYYKGLDLLLPALAEADDWHLVLVGPHWKDSRVVLDDLIRSLELGSRVWVLPPRRGSKLHEALAAADLFVLVSRSEGFPIALLEAFAHGTPALVSPAVESALGVAKEGAGWVADFADLAPSLKRLATADRSEWLCRQENALAMAEKYDWSEIAKRYEAAVKIVLERST